MKLKYRMRITALATLSVLAMATTLAHADFNMPAGFGSWLYTYEGSAAAYGAGTDNSWDALDGTWTHSGPLAWGAPYDKWDGSAIGGTLGPGNAPGGVQVGTDGSTTFLRMQDPGLTTLAGGTWPLGDNSAIYFGKNITSMVGDPFNILDAVTLRFRIRVPTGTGLDDRYDAGAVVSAYPTDIGDGYGNVNNGLGSIGIKASGNGLPSVRGQGAIGFSLGTSSDIGMPTNSGPALYINNMYSDLPANQVDWNEQGTRTPYVNNRLEIADATVWNDFWVTITENNTAGLGLQGTHTVTIYANGDLTPHVFAVTAGNANEDFGNVAALIMGFSKDNNQAGYLSSGALDVDFFSIKEGVWVPVPEPSTMAFMGLGLLALVNRFRRRS
jgi:hypothetical protein